MVISGFENELYFLLAMVVTLWKTRKYKEEIKDDQSQSPHPKESTIDIYK